MLVNVPFAIFTLKIAIESAPRLEVYKNFPSLEIWISAALLSVENPFGNVVIDAVIKYAKRDRFQEVIDLIELYFATLRPSIK